MYTSTQHPAKIVIRRVCQPPVAADTKPDERPAPRPKKKGQESAPRSERAQRSGKVKPLGTEAYHQMKKLLFISCGRQSTKKNHMLASQTVYRAGYGSTTAIYREVRDIRTATALGVFLPYLWFRIGTTHCPSSGRSNTASASPMELVFQVKLLQPAGSGRW